MGDIDDVLDEIMGEITGAARPWELPRPVVEEMRHRFRPSLGKVLKARSSWSWPRSSEKVLRMAKNAGILGAFFAEADGGRPQENVVQLKHMLMAMGVVKVWCTAGTTTEGKACEGFSVADGVQALQEFLRVTASQLPGPAPVRRRAASSGSRASARRRLRPRASITKR